MEELTEALQSRNIFVWIVLIFVLVLFLKFLKSAGKFFMILVFVAVIGLILHKFAPGVLDPIVDFVKGGWLGDQRP
jgi:accessory gene regulator protein AgrB